jgi:Tol biopolymer transport system component
MLRHPPRFRSRASFAIVMLFALAACPSVGTDRSEPDPIDFSHGIGCGDDSSSPATPSPNPFIAYTITGGPFARLVRDTLSGEHVGLAGLAVPSRDGRFISVSRGAEHWVLEMGTGTVVPVSVTPAGVYSKYEVVTEYADSISADGRFVAFHHGGADLVEGDTNNEQDVFVRDVEGGSTSRVSVSSSGEQANDESRLPSISADGVVVAFLSEASNLVPGDTNGAEDIFVHDRSTRTTTRIVNVQQRPDPTTGIGGFRTVGLSGDGRSVVFSTALAGLVSNDVDTQQDVFVQDLRSGRTARVSQPTDGGRANGRSYETVGPVSHDGTCIAFISAATNLVPDDRNSGIFVRDMTDGTIRRVSNDPAGIALNPGDSGVAALFPDGDAVAFVARGRTYVRDLAASTTTDAGPADPFLLPHEPRVGCERVRVIERPPTFDARPMGFATGVGYVSLEGDSLGLYSVSSDKVSRVLDAKRAGGVDDIAFRSSSAVTFEVGGGPAGFALCELRLDDGVVREVFRDQQLVSSDWSADGRTIAYMAFTKARLAVFVREEGGSPTKILDLGVWRGNGSVDEDREDRISWSPDGRHLLVGTGHAGARPAIRVIDRAGRLVTPMRFGTLARWVPVGSVIFRDHAQSPEEGGMWRVLDLENGGGPLGIEADTVRPAVSPDGRYVIVDDAGGEPRLFLFDLEMGTQEVLKRGYLDAIWLEPGLVSVIKAQPCERSPFPDPCAHSTAWHPVGSTRFTIDISSGRIASSALRLSRDMDVLYSSG